MTTPVGAVFDVISGRTRHRQHAVHAQGRSAGFHRACHMIRGFAQVREYIPPFKSRKIREFVGPFLLPLMS